MSSQQTSHIGSAIVALVLAAGLVGIAFWFTVTEVFSIRVRSATWWWLLILAFLVIILTAARLLWAEIHWKSKAAAMVIILAISSALLAIGLKHRPLSSENLKLKLGLVPMFGDLFGDDVAVIQARPEDVVVVEEYSDKQYMPSVIDQGTCGSCWAVATACVLSARYARYKSEQNGSLLSTNVVHNCTPAGIDMGGWHFSPQYLLDKDGIFDTPGQCTEDSYGKCNGNSQFGGFLLARNGVAHASCVPYFAFAPFETGGWCRTDCGSPITHDYLSCPSGKLVTQCIHDRSFQWTTCADGTTPVQLLVESYDVKHVIGEEAMKAEIVNNGPILAGINFYTKKDGSRCAWTLSSNDNLWGNYTDMITPGYVARPEMDGNEYTTDFVEGGHAVVIYGFGTNSDGVKYWLCRNSWGASWGADGDIKIERGINAWNIESFCATASVRDRV